MKKPVEKSSVPVARVSAATDVPPQYRAGERHINEYPLLDEEKAFIDAINAYKQRHARPFPTWSEVLYVLRWLGYQKGGVEMTVAPPGPTVVVTADAASATELQQVRADLEAARRQLQEKDREISTLKASNDAMGQLLDELGVDA